MNLEEIKPQKLPIKIKNKVYNLKYDFDSFATIEQMLGSIPEAFNSLNKFDLSVIKIFIWTGLDGEEEISKEKFDSMSLDANVLGLISLAVENSLSPEYDFFEDWDWPLFYYLGTVTLKMSEEEFWKSTPRKLISLLKINAETKNLDLSGEIVGVEKSKESSEDAVKQFMSW